MNKYTVEQLREMTQEVNGWDGSLEEFEYYEMEQLNDLLIDVKPTEVLRMAYFGDFEWQNDYFTFNGYGNLESISLYDMESELRDCENEIITRYNELVESGEIENIL